MTETETLKKALVSKQACGLTYCPKVVVALIVKSLQGTIPSNDGKRRRDVPKFPQYNGIGPICHLYGKKQFFYM